MEDQFAHKDEKGDREQSERSNGRKDSCHYRNKAWDPSKEEIGRNHIDNKKCKGNGQVGEKQEHHPPEEQANDQPPIHELLLQPQVPNPASSETSRLFELKKSEISIGNQGIRKSGCRIIENQDIRKTEKERILKPDNLIS
jgi:hypothetical protein